MPFTRFRRWAPVARGLFPLLVCGTLGLVGLAIRAAAPATPQAAKTHWYRGNTHVHTVLCGHADSAPEVVAKWYLDRGYHFLCLSEHNRFIDPANVALPPG